MRTNGVWGLVPGGVQGQRPWPSFLLASAPAPCLTLNPHITPARRMRPHRRWLLIAPPMLFLALFFLIPFATAFKISFADSTIAIPPFTKLLSTTPDGHWALTVTLDNYRYLVTDDVYLLSYIFSLRTAFFSTVICLLLGYPMAYAIARAPRSTQTM